MIATPGPACPPLPVGADECVTASGAPRPAYARTLAAALGDAAMLTDMRDRAIAWFAGRGITFGVPALEGAPIIPFDPIPRVLAATEWRAIDRALAQRVMALDAFVADCYGAQRALRDGVVPARLVYSSTGYLRDLVGVRPPRATHCHVAGIDVVRVDGTFLVLEDNVRVPSGIAYALVAREATLELARDWITAAGVRSIDGYASRLRRTLERIAPRPWEARIAVLTPGPYNAAFFEHRMLADAIGGVLVSGDEIVVHEDEVYCRCASGLERVDVIYSRVNAEWLDPLLFRPESLLGPPGLVEAWRRGNVAIANAPGSGVADDKAIYPYVPAMVRYYLGEEPLIDNVPTYDISDDRQRRHVVAHLDRMVIKPVDSSGGYGVTFGRLMSAAERAATAAELEAQPRGWLAQEEVALSRALCLSPNGGLEARAVDLRPFVLLDEQPWVVPGGLTRVARDTETLVVNSSQGGGSKDTWILTR
ncbi:MAG: circularly permuted type 2 ATP-grasp protein [Chloroflexi bacterium]|nr:MAG: circularly permuted type 2 ATP-grasp protein [Chloroflexota bacterium]